jgi:TRAP-type C4-dicarboxylate transport system permease small subunit
MWWETVVKNEHSESLWGPPLWIPFLFLPLGMTLLFMQYIVFIWRKIKHLREGEIEEKIIPSELADVKIEEEATLPE